MDHKYVDQESGKFSANAFGVLRYLGMDSNYTRIHAIGHFLSVPLEHLSVRNMEVGVQGEGPLKKLTLQSIHFHHSIIIESNSILFVIVCIIDKVYLFIIVIKQIKDNFRIKLKINLIKPGVSSRLSIVKKQRTARPAKFV